MANEEKIRNELANNSYPAAFITYHSKSKPKKPVTYDVQRKPVFITLPFKGDNVNTTIRKRLQATIGRSYPAAQLIWLNKSLKMGPSNTKNKPSVFATSKCIYKFECICGCKYIGRTDRKLEIRIHEHIPKWLIDKKPGIAKTAISRHLKTTHHVVDRYKSFSIINRQNHSKLLRFAEACSIRKLKPDLCVQKEFVTPLSLPWG